MIRLRASYFIALLLAQACVATEPDRNGGMFRSSQSVDTQTDSRPTMSLESLRVCVALEYETRALQSDFDSAKLALELAERDFRSIDQIVQTQKQFLDRTDGRAVDDFNRKVGEQARTLDAFNARVEPYNRLLDALDAATTRFNRDCTRPYLEKDMLAVLVEREAALKAEIEGKKKP
jgi:hypothetical protein